MEFSTATRDIEARITEIAAEQHGVVSRRQLIEAGWTGRVIQRRASNGHLRRLHRGVFQMGPLVSPRAREMAAVLACRDGAVLSHRSAAALWELLPRPGEAYPVELSVDDRDSGYSRPGIRLHRVVRLEAHDRAVVDRIPVTAPIRTLLDLAGAASSVSPVGRGKEDGAGVIGTRELEQAVARAEREGLVDLDELSERLAGRHGRRGTPLLQELLGSEHGPALTRSEAEERFLALIRRAKLPAPGVNRRMGPYEVDFLWRDLGIAVEVDGFAFHASRRRFEGDRRRDAELAAAGVHVTRVTWRQIVDEPEAVLARVARALGRAGLLAPSRPGV